MLYDLIIIGAGPAGITSAIYAERRKLKTLILSMDIGGQVSWSSEVDNYPGLPNSTGAELVKKFKEHIDDYKIKVKNYEVLDVRKKGNFFEIKTKKKVYKTKSVIIASGKKPKKLEVPGEEKYLGKGVSYFCPLYNLSYYKSKKMAIIGGGNSALEASLFLSNYAKKVYIIDINEKLGGTPILRDRIKKKRKIIHLNNSKIKEILGNSKVSGIKYSRNNLEKTLKIHGVIIEIGLIPRCDFAKKVEKNKWGEIRIFRSTKTKDENMTNISGIFAAGDVTDIPAKQIVAAAGEGCKAALAAIEYVDNWNKNNSK